MKIYNISNFGAFFEALDRCESDVVLTTEDGCQYNWKTQRDAFRSLAGSIQGGRMRQLGVRASGGDGRHLMEYAVCAGKRSA